jgi:KipI family sensor histidine kinase inhibitor
MTTGQPALHWECLGESALQCELGTTIRSDCNDRVHALAAAIRRAQLPGVSDLVPGYASLTVHFDPLANPCADDAARNLAESIQSIFSTLIQTDNGAGRLIEVPLCYGAEFGPDLAALAQHCGLSEEIVCARHCAVEYTVALLGFAPGFPYLLGLDPSLETPRRANPRTRVPPGSVAIGGAQTGIYPRELPGGWNLIGRTPERLFDPSRASPALLTPGDRVRFHPIDAVQFATMSSAG